MIQVGDLRIGKEEKKAVNQVLNNNRITEGIKTLQFERAWAKYLGAKYCIATNSGTSALICALNVIKELVDYRNIITTPLTYIATANAIKLSGFQPLFVDIRLDTFGMKEELADLYSPHGIVLPVHLFGYPVDLNKLKQKYVIEDACQAHGSIYRGKKVGTIGMMGCFSFYLAHNIAVGEMGAVVTNDERCYKLLKQIKAHGRECQCAICHRETCPVTDHDPRFTHTTFGYNFKTMDLISCMALVQVKKVDSIIKKRQKNVYNLNKGLKDVKGLILPKFDKNVSYLAYPLILKSGSRYQFCKQLEEKGIETRPMFGCIPTQQPSFRDYPSWSGVKHFKQKYEGKLPNAEFAGSQGFYLGCHQYMNSVQTQYISKTIKEIL